MAIDYYTLDLKRIASSAHGEIHEIDRYWVVAMGMFKWALTIGIAILIICAFLGKIVPPWAGTLCLLGGIFIIFREQFFYYKRLMNFTDQPPEIQTKLIRETVAFYRTMPGSLWLYKKFGQAVYPDAEDESEGDDEH